MIKQTSILSARAAAAVSKVLHQAKSNKAAKSANGSALSQITVPTATSAKMLSAATKTLHTHGLNKAAKMSAGSALTPTPY